MRLLSLDGCGIERRSLLLAPTSVNPGPFANFVVDSMAHRSRLAEAQRLRGRIALQEGAVDSSQLLPDGRHVQSLDSCSWHLLTLDAHGRVAACMRYLPHRRNAAFHDLSISATTLAHSKTCSR